MRRSSKIISVLLLAGAVVYYFGWHKESADKAGDKKKGATVVVSVATATKGDMDVYVAGIGTITARNTAVLKVRVDGEIVKLPFKEGDTVKQGDLVAEIDPRPYIAQVEQAEGQLLKDQALLQEAKLDLARYQTLFRQDAIPKQQLDTQVSLVKQDEGNVKNDQGLLDTAKLQVTYTRIIAPFAGQVGLRQVDLGNIAQTGDTTGIVILNQLQPITALFTLPEDTIGELVTRFHSSEKVIAEAWDKENRHKLATGELMAIDNQIDPTTGTIKLRAEFPNEDNQLFPNQFVNVKCKINTKKDVVMIPVNALQHGSQGNFVYLAKDDNTVSVKNVTVTLSDDKNAAIAEGVNPGDRLVTDGADGLREGTKIEIVDKNAKPSSDKSDKKDEKKHHKKEKE